MQFLGLNQILAAHFAKRNTKFGGGGKARAGKNSWWTLTLQPPSFLPARAFSFGSAARSAAMGQFLSKKVRAKCIITAPHHDKIEEIFSF